MAWTYQLFADTSSAANVIGRVVTQLNGLNSNVSATAKVGHSDVNGGKAHGAVIYNNSAGAPPPHTLTGPWQQRTWVFTDGTQYEKHLQEVCSLLNGEGERPLTEVEAAHAKFSMSDLAGGACHMALFWQRAQ